MDRQKRNGAKSLEIGYVYCYNYHTKIWTPIEMVHTSQTWKMKLIIPLIWNGWSIYALIALMYDIEEWVAQLRHNSNDKF